MGVALASLASLVGGHVRPPMRRVDRPELARAALFVLATTFPCDHSGSIGEPISGREPRLLPKC